MDNKIKVFENTEFGSVRTMTINGEPWFVGKDVCSILNLSNPTIAVSRLDEDERAKFNLGRQGDATIVNEPGTLHFSPWISEARSKSFQKTDYA